SRRAPSPRGARTRTAACRTWTSTAQGPGPAGASRRTTWDAWAGSARESRAPTAGGGGEAAPVVISGPDRPHACAGGPRRVRACPHWGRARERGDRTASRSVPPRSPPLSPPPPDPEPYDRVGHGRCYGRRHAASEVPGATRLHGRARAARHSLKHSSARDSNVDR